MTSLAAKYALVIGSLVSGALVASAAVQTSFTFGESRESLIAVQREKADVAAARIEQFFHEIEQQLDWVLPPEGLAGAPPPGVAPPPSPTGPPPGGQPSIPGAPAPPTLVRRSQDFARLLEQAPTVVRFSYIDETGRERYRLTRSGSVEAVLDHSRDPLFLVPRSGKVYYGPVSFRDGLAQTIVVSIPDSGPNRSVLAAEVDLSAVRTLIEQMRFGRAGYAALLDPTGATIARPTALDPAALEGETLEFMRTIDPLGWTIVVHQPAAEVFEPLNALLVRTGVLLVFGLTISVAASLVLARRMTTPIRALREGAARIGAGALGERIAITSRDELGALAAELNHMAERLQESYATLERRVDERTRELSDALAELAEARDTALVATRNKSAFLASMSHELRTPLSAIIGFAEVLTETEMEVDETTQREFLEDILAAGRHLLQLINDILDISKAEAGRMEFVPEYFEVEPAVRGVGAVAKALVGRKHQTLDLRVEPGAGVVHHDPARFKQVLFNLISNAVKFTPDGGTIRVLARRTDDASLEVAVSDNGIGMKPEDQERVFEEFQQLATGRGREQQGTGLGLALVRRFVRTMGGDVWVSSELDAGSTFTFRLPPVSPTPEGTAAVNPPESAQPAYASA